MSKPEKAVESRVFTGESVPPNELVSRLGYLFDNPDVALQQTEMMNGELHLTLESKDGYKVVAVLVPFEKTASKSEQERLTSENFIVADYYVAHSISIQHNGHQLDLATLADGIGSRVLVPKIASPVKNTAFKESREIADVLMQKLMMGEHVGPEEMEKIRQPRAAVPSELLGELSEDQFYYLVRNYFLFRTSGARKLPTGEQYIFCPIPITDYGLYVFLHEFGHLLDPDDFNEIIKHYEQASYGRETLTDGNRAGIMTAERRADANAAVIFRRLIKELNASPSKQIVLGQAMQIHLYRYYTRIGLQDRVFSHRKDVAGLSDDQIEAITNFN